MTATATARRRRDADFRSRGTRCAAWLYRPGAVADPPVVVMAHGFGGERDWRLPAFAERFADRGLASLVFDYRRFGDSDGRPRNLVTPRGHVRDYLAAIDHVRGLDDVDGARLALWGTSFSGGHALVAAARDGAVDAVVCQTPVTDGLATGLSVVRAGGVGYLARALVSAGRDLVRLATRRSPYDVPVAGEPDGFALLNRPGTLEGIEAIAGGPWDNRCPARVIPTSLAYRPVAVADRVRCPALVVQADADDVAVGRTVDRLVARLADVERVRVPVGHWDVYTGAPFEAVVEREAAFLERHLVG